jgi:RNA polymerase sigma-70 factor (ECF subfamily)
MTLAAVSVTSLPIAPPRLRVASTKESRFRAMYEAHVDFVWRNLRRLGVLPCDVDDKTQEVFVIAHRRWDDFEDQGHGPRAWLFQIALRVAADARRHRRRHPEEPDGGITERHAPASAFSRPQSEFARLEARDRLERALSGIELSKRAVLVLFEIEEMTAGEIADVLKIPPNTVYSRLRAARAQLEAALAAQENLAPNLAPANDANFR